MHNIILNSIPKSGTSLIGNIFEIIGYKYAGASLTPHNALGNTIKAILRNPLPGDKAANLSFEATSLVSHNYVKRVLKKGKQPNYVSAHMAYCPVIELILKDLNFKHILLIRNPKDVILSYCFYVKTCKSHLFYNQFKNNSLEEVFDCLSSGGVFCGYSVKSFEKAYRSVLDWKSSKKGEVLLVKYEDLVGEEGGGSKNDLINALKNIQKFLEIDKIPAYDKFLSAYGKGHTFRKGKINSWKIQNEISLSRFEELNTLSANFGY